MRSGQRSLWPMSGQRVLTLFYGHRGPLKYFKQQMTSQWHLHRRERTWYFVTRWSGKASWSESTNNRMLPERGRETPGKSSAFPLGERRDEEGPDPGAEIRGRVVKHTQSNPRWHEHLARMLCHAVVLRSVRWQEEWHTGDLSWAKTENPFQS